MKTLAQNVAIIIFSALVSGCASTTGVRLQNQSFMQTLRENGKATIANFGSGHIAWESKGTEYIQPDPHVGAIRQEKINSGIISKVPIDKLDEKCLAAIEDVLVSQSNLNYIARSKLGLMTSWPDNPSKYKVVSMNNFNWDLLWEDFYKINENYAQLMDKNGITAFIKVKLTYYVAFGWKKPPRLRVDWNIVTIDGQSKYRVITIETAAVGREIFVNTQDPKYADDYIALARQNALQFLNFLAK